MAGASELIVKITGKDVGLKQVLNNAGDDVGRFGDRMDGLGGKIASFGKAAAVGFAAVGVAAGGGLVKAISAGSDLAESLSKSNTIFGQNAAEMEKWAGTASRSFGQSKQQALEAGASFGNMFTQLGIGSGEAAKMSRSMVELASDFASFHNADITEVLEAQSAAFRGEYDSVQKFVPTINAAAVEQKALEMGLAGTTKELTMQDKALATQALLISGAGAAMGDYDRTSKGLANRMRELKARGEDFAASIGTAVIPILLKVMDVAEKVGAVVAPALKGLFDLVFKGDFTGGLGKALGLEEDSAIVEKILRIRDTVIGLFDLFVKGDFTGRLGKALGLEEDSAVIAKLFAIRDAVIDMAKTAVAFVQENWPKIQETVSAVMETVVAVVAGVVDVVTTIWNNFGEQIVDYTQRSFNNAAQMIGGVMDVIQGIIATVTAIIHGDWSAAWEGIKQVLAGAFDAMIGFAKQWDNIMRSLMSVAMEILGSIIRGGFEAIVGFVASIPGRIVGALGDMGSLLWDAGYALMIGLLNGIKAAVTQVYNFVAGIAGKIASLKGPIEKDRRLLIPAGEAIMDSLVAGLRNHEGHLVRQLRHITGLVVSVNRSTSAGLQHFKQDPGDVGGPVYMPQADGTNKLVGYSSPHGTDEHYNQGGSGQNVTINITVNSDVDPHHLAREIAWAMGG